MRCLLLSWRIAHIAMRDVWPTRLPRCAAAWRVRRVLGSRGADEETLRELLQQMFDLHQATKERHSQELMGRRGAIQ